MQRRQLLYISIYLYLLVLQPSAIMQLKITGIAKVIQSVGTRIFRNLWTTLREENDLVAR